MIKARSQQLQLPYIPECVAMAFVMYLELGLCLVVLSNHLRTSSTACGFFFCSCLLMFEFISRRAHASGIPCKMQKQRILLEALTQQLKGRHTVKIKDRDRERERAARESMVGFSFTFKQ